MINKKQRGFTVIELVVAMGVFLSLFLIVIVNFRSGESINELKLETQKIASDIRKVQTLAMTGSHYNGNPISVGGYGIKFSAGGTGPFVYEMFNDANADGIYTEGDTPTYDGNILETRSLVNNINSLALGSYEDNDEESGAYTSYTNVYIVFKPYSSEISITDGAVMITDELKISIQHTRATGKTGVVSAAPVSGKIDFEMR